jgi:hypothetical protein
VQVAAADGFLQQRSRSLEVTETLPCAKFAASITVMPLGS